MPQPPPLFMSESVDEFQQRGNPQGNFPKPGPAPDEETAKGFVLPPVEYFEPIGPVKEEIIWNNHRIPVEFQLLDMFEERQLARDVSFVDEPEKIFAERQWRIARSLVSVNGKKIHFSDDWLTDRIEREAWAERFQGSLLFALSSAYERAASQPLVELEKHTADPK